MHVTNDYGTDRNQVTEFRNASLGLEIEYIYSSFSRKDHIYILNRNLCQEV